MVGRLTILLGFKIAKYGLLAYPATARLLSSPREFTVCFKPFLPSGGLHGFLESSRQKMEKSWVTCFKSCRQEATDCTVLCSQMPLKEKTGQVVPCPA